MSNETEYEYCGDGLLLPLLNEEEKRWNQSFRAVLYLFALLYCFLGVAIIADVFMSAIEVITSKTRKIYLARPSSPTTGVWRPGLAKVGDAAVEEGKGTSSNGTDHAGSKDPGGSLQDASEEPEVVEVRVWNDTVANLTLMALGSSAPEILLSVIELSGRSFEAGDLGPGTIVGSAAFNLLIITAVCVVGVPDGETRRIKGIKVFGVTTIFSLFAYAWLLVILVAVTPDVVDIWEAALTLLFFPLLVILAYMADKTWKCCGASALGFGGKKQLELGAGQLTGNSEERMLGGKTFFRNGNLDKDGLVAFVKEVKKYPGLSDEDAALLAASRLVDSQPHSRMWYRIGAVRSFTGGRKTQPKLSLKLQELLDKPLKTVYDTINEHPNAPNIGKLMEPDELRKAVIEFRAATVAVPENVGTFEVTITRRGDLQQRAKVKVESIDGTAQENEDYIPINEIIVFEPNETEKQVKVEIVNDNQWEPDEEFFLKLAIADDDDTSSVKGGEEREEKVQLGRISIMEITILNDDEPGLISFPKRGLLVKETIGTAQITVLRKDGADGEVSVSWRTLDKSAVSGKDYKGGSGVLVFKHTEVSRVIEIPIINDMEAEKDECFEIELFNPTGGAKLGAINRMAITITNDEDFNNVMGHLMSLTNANMDAIRVHRDTWASQIKDAMNVNGGDLENATWGDYLMHFLTFGWKVLFALVPPPGLLGGWPCFFVSLFMIGLITAFVGDIAAIFGCIVHLHDSITAITLVAMGTSLPDTFASKCAAVQEKHADNAIGNITGSNSVNVFLGLGLPWLMGAIYHYSKGNQFSVPVGSLGFSVMVYTCTSLFAVALLLLRRNLSIFGRAELGGPKPLKILSAVILVFLWVLYVFFSILQTYGYINDIF
ncbi:sodium/calcium exchanger 1-like isoform X2 [Ischnura elegans]|uniref:sodium/calcium exchanger 1-like isoform X2 n=1 Tax=Ischnura elegans TaxID=197161 RepID=UPI001ED8891D|nr:sodium/calcium exchanger 1-like isoform X2 [Ischnura elegans]